MAKGGRIYRTIWLEPVKFKKGPHAGEYQLRAGKNQIKDAANRAGIPKKQAEKTVQKYKRKHNLHGFKSSDPGEKKIVLRTKKSYDKRKQAKSGVGKTQKLLDTGFNTPYFG